MKIKNYTKILEMVMASPGINRKKVSTLTKLSNQTLSNLVKDLSDFGYILEFPLDGPTGYGRKPIGLKLNYKAFLIVSLEFTYNSFGVYLNTGDGEVLLYEKYALHKSQDVVSLIKRGVEKALKHANSRVFALVMSAEGIIDEENRKLTHVKALSLKNLDLGKELAYLDLPLFLLNDTNLISHYVNLTRVKPHNFMVVKLDTGIGCSIALDRHIQKTSANNMPGKLGHLKVANTDEDVLCWCGGKNCLSAFISRDYIESRFNRPYEEALMLIRDGQEPAFREKIIMYLSPILANITTLLGIEKIYAIGKMVDVLGSNFIRTLDRSITPSIPSWINFLGVEEFPIPSIPVQCSAYFMDYFLNNILSYLEDVDETPFKVEG
ncbi:MAG: ROK family protein [Sphaerochaeta sp.]|nr:ROK family protein [Sphaerochaeta sp.]